MASVSYAHAGNVMNSGTPAQAATVPFVSRHCVYAGLIPVPVGHGGGGVPWPVPPPAGGAPGRGGPPAPIVAPRVPMRIIVFAAMRDAPLGGGGA
ncbi:MAG TPA: hypothetical protein VH044_09910, partial [Polyangiaceae bacterium]|nr:hypothetical protein [Polyangiaceae bacterium]